MIAIRILCLIIDPMGIKGKSNPGANIKNKPGRLNAGAQPSRKEQFRHGEQIDFIISDSGIEKKNPVPAQVLKKRPEDQTKASQTASGISRAAKLLLALGPEESANILKEMSDSEVENIVREMLTIKSISAEEKKEILDDFRHGVNHFDPPVSGGIQKTRDILVKGLGDSRAEEILSRLNRHNLKHDFEFLEQIDPPALATALSFEHPQTTAVALSFIQPRIAASVLKHLPDALRSEIAMRIAKTSRTHPDAVQSIAQVLREKFEKRKDEFFSEIGGAETLANILNHMDRGMEDDILNVLGDQSPDIMNDVKEMLYTFEELVSLSGKEMRLLLSRINDDMIIASALRGAGDEIRRHFFNSISQNRAADIMDEIDRRGPISLKEINEARSYIVNTARRIDEEGSIVIKKQKEEYL